MNGFPPSVMISEGDAESGDDRNDERERNYTTKEDIEIDRWTDKPGQYAVSEVTPTRA